MAGTSVLNTLTVIKTGRQFDLNPADEAYTTWAPIDAFKFGGVSISENTAARALRGPVWTGLQRQGRKFTVKHQVATTGVHNTNLARLRSLYDPKYGECTLAFDFDGEAVTARVKPLRLLPHSSGSPRGAAEGEWLLLSDVYYAATGDTIATSAISTSGNGINVHNRGNVDSRKVTYTVQPTTAKTAANGQRYVSHALVINRAPRALRNHPVELTGSGWDHAAEVTATRSSADGSDVEVYVQGIRVPVWDGAGTAAFNQSGTRLWVGLDVPAGRRWKHGGSASILSSATSFETSTDVSNMPSAPFFAAFYDTSAGHEQVLVTAVQRLAGGGGVLTLERGKRDSTAVTHAAGTPLWWTPVLPDVVYGWTSASVAAWIDDRYKPIPAEHQSSDNDAWTFAQYAESEAAAGALYPRPGSWRPAWKPRNRMGDWSERDDMYTSWVAWTGGLGSDSATATTMALGYKKNPPSGKPPADRWELFSGIAMTQLDITETTASMTHPGAPNEGRLDVRVVATDGTERTLASYDGDTAQAKSISPSPGALVFILAIDPYDITDLEDNSTGASAVVAAEPADDDGFLIAVNAVVTFDTSESLLVVMQARSDAYQLGRPGTAATLSNVLAESLEFPGIVVPLNTTLTVDVEARTITDGDGLAYGHLVEGEWPEVPADPAALPYSSAISYTESGIGTVTVGATVYSAWQ